MDEKLEVKVEGEESEESVDVQVVEGSSPFLAENLYDPLANLSDEQLNIFNQFRELIDSRQKEEAELLGNPRQLQFCTNDCLCRYLRYFVKLHCYLEREFNLDSLQSNRARNWDISKAQLMLEETLKWRAQVRLN
jgi:hypothetical protein